MDSQSSLMMIGGSDGQALLDYSGGGQAGRYARAKIKRSDFGDDFVWGSATSAYQVEGAWATDGKGPSNWDVFSMRTPGKINGGTNGCVAIDQYHLWKEDVALIKKVGLDSYRFSIAWSRLLPGGRLSAGINKEGIKFYSDLIDLLLAEGIEPCATIFHWDVPQCLEEEYGGFLSPRIVKDYCEFAELCFWEFGDRVKHWITLNEPWTFTFQGYVEGTMPPGRGATSAEPVKTIPHHRCRYGVPFEICPDGNPGTEPYIVAHHLILSHAAAVEIYRQRYQTHQGGKIGVTNVSKWFEPLNDTTTDKEAALRAVDFMLGWFVAPVVTGDYPPIMRKLVGDRLPSFSPEQTKLVKGSYDFLGINYYTTNYATNSPRKPCTKLSYKTDQDVEILRVDEVNDTTKTVAEARIDEMRIKYHQDHLYYVKKAMDEGVNVKSYYIWSMFDNYEWAEGYSVRFGIFYVDFLNGRLTRFPKTSAIWFMNFLEKPALLKRQAEENEKEYGSAKRLRSSKV
ncbi:Beta-glucosidase 17 [Forsythia ovata]|uniref:Beta-glucosidase 17 n=1 Tax=Forsythia ovata TaxID=205694 RepID=A0ABD1SRC0_9LAMI